MVAVVCQALSWWGAIVMWLPGNRWRVQEVLAKQSPRNSPLESFHLNPCNKVKKLIPPKCCHFCGSCALAQNEYQSLKAKIGFSVEAFKIQTK